MNIKQFLFWVAVLSALIGFLIVSAMKSHGIDLTEAVVGVSLIIVIGGIGSAVLISIGHMLRTREP